MNFSITVALLAIAGALIFVGLEIRQLNENIITISSQIEPLTKLPENIAFAFNPFSNKPERVN
ncbi:hypothetical protein H0X48_03640 [Candidatus Dependentiae bacterium]|nr:hypothetical protein [Candidatus Dependentiae bacterium]